jgi:hypothetical protein
MTHPVGRPGGKASQDMYHCLETAGSGPSHVCVPHTHAWEISSGCSGGETKFLCYGRAYGRPESLLQCPMDFQLRVADGYGCEFPFAFLGNVCISVRMSA